ncbi:ABC transporter substrate-binding protein [Candidatus Woesearchaeota archaeon]|nr:ABC transporter substrate-binding protein [Candidatus Woesearchaeota archaeon]
MKKLLTILLIVAVLISCAPVQPQTQPTKTETPSEPAEAKTDFVVGLSGPLTGGAATIGVPVKEAAELAVEEINANDILTGRKMTLLIGDDACDPKTTTTLMQKYTEVDKVTAIAGPFCSGTVLAAAPILEQNKVLAIAPGATNPKIKDAGDYIFRVVPPDSNQGAEGAKLVEKLGAKKVGVLYINNDYGVGLKNAFLENVQKSGLNTQSEAFETGATDMKTQITKLSSFKPDVIYLVTLPAEGIIALKQLAEAGLKVPVLSGDGAKDDALVAGAKEAAEGLILTAPAVPKTPELDSFAEKFKAKYGKEYSIYTPEMYDVVNILAKACANTDCTSTAMKDYLYTMGEYKGASGSFTFDKNGEVEKSYDYFQVKDGKFVAYEVS